MEIEGLRESNGLYDTLVFCHVKTEYGCLLEVYGEDALIFAEAVGEETFLEEGVPTFSFPCWLKPDMLLKYLQGAKKHAMPLVIIDVDNE